ncbi:hypothetical protein [Stieleria varia]|nr:hypothetical protein [Stieleria varia]
MTDDPRLNPYAPPKLPSSVRTVDDHPPHTDDLPADLQHVTSAVNYAIVERQENDDDEVHIDASEICQMVLSLACRMTAYDPTGGEALAYLSELNVQRSEDVGLAIDELNRLGLTRADDDDDPSDFIGLFDLAVPTADWKLDFDLAKEMAFVCSDVNEEDGR